MFLVVFVTLVISIIGLYAQIISLQAAKIYNSQVALMQTMATWHSAAVSLAVAKPPVNTGGLTGCQMNANNATVCKDSGGNPLLVTNNLPPGNYNFSFFSYAYQSGSPVATYVITYLPFDSKTGFLTLAGGGSSGYSPGDLLHQFAQAGSVNLAYGTVTASGTLTATLKSLNTTSGNMVYSSANGNPIPGSIPAGSVAVISVAQ